MHYKLIVNISNLINMINMNNHHKFYLYIDDFYLATIFNILKKYIVIIITIIFVINTQKHVK